MYFWMCDEMLSIHHRVFKIYAPHCSLHIHVPSIASYFRPVA
jgi:hypothetical protein